MQDGERPFTKICFTNEIYEALVIFHEDNLMELSIEDKKTGETPFYLHFEARDTKTAHDNVQAFFAFFCGRSPVKEHLDVTGVKYRQPVRLLVSCTSGLTSSYFAYTMKHALDKVGVEAVIDAVSVTEIDKKYFAARYLRGTFSLSGRNLETLIT